LENTYLLDEEIPCKLIVGVYKGKLICRISKTNKRFSYNLVKRTSFTICTSFIVFISAENLTNLISGDRVSTT